MSFFIHRFQDKVVVQGFFHPRERVSALYTWLESLLLLPPSSSSENHENDKSSKEYPFELYTTPPRRVLESPHALAIKVAEEKRKRKGMVLLEEEEEEAKDGPSFMDLQLVPAAVVYFSFVGEREKEKTGN